MLNLVDIKDGYPTRALIIHNILYIFIGETMARCLGLPTSSHTEYCTHHHRYYNNIIYKNITRRRIMVVIVPTALCTHSETDDQYRYTYIHTLT